MESLSAHLEVNWSGGLMEQQRCFYFIFLLKKTFCKLHLHLLKEYMCVCACVFSIVTVDADKCLLASTSK